MAQHNEDSTVKTDNSTITQQDIARTCGLHQTTVSLVLRGDSRVGAETTRRVLDAAKALGYDADAQDTARRMISRRFGTRMLNQTIGLFFPAHMHQVRYFAEIQEGIADALTDAEFSLLTSYIPAFGDVNFLKLPPCYKREQVDGIIVLQPPVALRAFAGQLRALRGFGQRPILSLVWPVEDCASIVTDNAGGTYQAAKHLLARGHRHLLQFVTEFSDIYDAGYVVHTRLAGLTRALEEAGLDPAGHLHPMLLPPNWQDPANLLLETYRWSPSNLEDVAAHPLVSYLREHPEITAVLGWNDACAIRACFLLRAAGLRVPEDISIVGFDDTDPLPGPEGANLLSSVHLPLYEMGRLAAQTIIRLVTAKTWQPEQLMLPTEFIPRASIAPAKTK